jgi:hypothetical protein
LREVQPSLWFDTCIHSRCRDLAKRWGKRFWQSCRVKAEIGSLATPSSGSRFFHSLHLNMDTIFVDQALRAYRDKTGDMRPFEALPVEVTSKILREAQRLKGFGNGSFPQPAAADGCVDS